MHCDGGVIHQALEKFPHQVHVKLADHGTGKRHVKDEAGATGQIHHHPRQGFVEGHIGVAVTAQALLVAKSLGQGLADGDADIFSGVMAVNVQVALGLHRQIHHAVAGNLIEHVIEKTDAGRKLRHARAIKVEADADLGFQGVAGDFGLPHDGEKLSEMTGHDTISERFATPSTHCFQAMSQYWSPLVHSLTPYVPGEQPKLPNLIKLNTNENPYGPSPKALEALRGEVGDSLRLYPDPEASRLKAAVASFFGNIEAKNVFVGNGSDEVLAHIFNGLLKHELPLLFPDITYSFYPVYCGLYDVGFEAVPLAEDFSIRVDDYLRPNGGIIFPNPNAPTGCLLPLAQIDRLLAGNPDSVVVVDEAYVDFGGESAVALVGKYPNLLVVHTLSKSRSLAGLRVGYAIGHVDLIDGLERIKNSFNSYPLDRFAIAGATAALEDREWFERTRQAVIKSRTALTAGMEQLGFQVLPSAANFIFARHLQRDAAELAKALRERSIIVRHFKQPRIDQFLRITIGTDEQCEALVTALKAILG